MLGSECHCAGVISEVVSSVYITVSQSHIWKLSGLQIFLQFFFEKTNISRKSAKISRHQNIFYKKWSLCFTCCRQVLPFCNKLKKMSTFVNFSEKICQISRENSRYFRNFSQAIVIVNAKRNFSFQPYLKGKKRWNRRMRIKSKRVEPQNTY
jgi:hypothetical protein